MAHIGQIGQRVKIIATFKKSFEYTDHKFSYYGTTHFIHTFEDESGNILVWKSTSMVECINDGKDNPNRKGDVVFIPLNSVVELTGTVKEHSEYKGTDQTVVTRCRFNLIERAKTQAEINRERAEAQQSSIGENDFIWEMPYSQYKAHYSDCETVIGSYNDHTNSRGIPHGNPTVKVIIREGRLKNSGVRGQHFKVFFFKDSNGGKISFKAVSPENAEKQLKKAVPNPGDFTLCDCIVL